MTLTEFLLARLAEDEGVWRMTYHPTNPMGAFLLADVEAKRRIVEHVTEYGSPDEWTTWQPLRLLALPYADHPDYDESWRP